MSWKLIFITNNTFIKGWTLSTDINISKTSFNIQIYYYKLLYRSNSAREFYLSVNFISITLFCTAGCTRWALVGNYKLNWNKYSFRSALLLLQLRLITPGQVIHSYLHLHITNNIIPWVAAPAVRWSGILKSHVRGWLSAASLVICSPHCNVKYVELRGYCPV